MFWNTCVLILLLATFTVRNAAAREPTCAVLLCSEESQADAWLHGAQDEALITLETLLGGFALGSNALVNGCGESDTLLDAPMCIEHVYWKDECHTKNCAFEHHRELYGDDDGCCGKWRRGKSSHGKGKRKDSVCRHVRQWAAIGMEKLYTAYDLLDAGEFANATSHACVAERLLRLVNERVDSPFADEAASYRHIVGDAFLVSYSLESGDDDLVLGTRTVQSFRRALSASGQPHDLVATYVLARVLERSIDEAEADEAMNGATQVLWPVSGLVASFDASDLPPTNECARARLPTTIDPAFDEERALPTLGPQDFAVIVDGFARCAGLPLTSSSMRRSTELHAAGTCGSLVLISSVDAEAIGKRVEPFHASLGYVAHRKSSVTYESDEERAVGIEETLVARVAAADVCEDFEPASVELDDVEDGDDDESAEESEEVPEEEEEEADAPATEK